MIDDRLGVVGAEPGPAVRVAAVGVELLPLARRVEDPKVGCGVGAAAGRPLPAERVGGEVGVDERVPEPPRPLEPRHPQVFHQEARHDHPHAVVHPAGRPELPHAGIDDRIARAAPLPGPQADRVVRPGKLRVVGPQRRVARVRKVEQQVIGELPPAELAEIGLGAAAGDLRRGRAADGRADRMPDAAGRDLAEVQVRRQAARALAIGPVAIGGIPRERRVEKPRQPLLAARGARRPGLRHRAVPGDRGEQPERGERLGPGRRLCGPQPAGRRDWLGRLVLREQRPPERREHLVGPALLRGHVHRLEEQRPVEALHREPVGRERLLDLRVAGDHRRLVAAVPDDPARPALLRDRPEHLERAAAADHQRGPGLRQRRGELLERVVEPPPRRGAWRPRLLLVGCPDEHRHDRAAGRRGGEGGVVVEPEVVAKPDDRGAVHGGSVGRTRAAWRISTGCCPRRPVPSAI